jgi:dipeptidyl-peptidase-4
MKKLICAAALLAGVPAAAETADCFYDLAATRNYELGYPARATPTPDGKAVIYLRASARDATQHLYEYDLVSGREKELVTPEQLLGGADETLSVEEKARRERARITAKGFTEFQLTEDGSTVLVGLSGKLYAVSRADGAVRPVPGEGWIAPRLSSDGSHLAAVHGGDLSSIDLKSGAVTALTAGASPTLQRGTADFAAAEELDRQDGAWWSPDGRFVAYEEADSSAVEPHFIANAVNPSQAPDEFRYPRTGTENAKLRVGIVPVTGGATVWAEWDNKAFPYLARVVWPKKGPLSLLVMNRAQTEERLLTVDPRSGATTVLLADQDKDWLELAPDAGNGRTPSVFPRWLEDGSGFLWATERSGQWQIELHRPDGALVRKVTPDGFRVGSLADIDEKRGEIVVAGGSDRLSSALYKVKLSGGKPVPLVAERGANGAEFGSGHAVFVNSYSWADGGRGVRVLNRDGKVLATLPSTAEQPPSLPEVSWLTVGAHDLDAQIVRPHDFQAGKRYPVLLSVYAGPTLKNVVAVRRRVLAQQCMADHGYIVVTVDNRGTPGRDHDFGRAVKGNLIDVALADQVEGVQALGAKFPEMDLSRVGVYGWSFGGYFSTMATLRRPDVFKAGIAGAPVIDWQDYDTAYTERYLGLPSENAEGYRVSNALTYADQLERPLMLIHGVTDDNVYFENTLKMIRALFAAGKPYELVLLPGTHQLPDPTLRSRLDQREVQFFDRELKAAP